MYIGLENEPAPQLARMGWGNINIALAYTSPPVISGNSKIYFIHPRICELNVFKEYDSVAVVIEGVGRWQKEMTAIVEWYLF